jgi:hypothetical protein
MGFGNVAQGSFSTEEIMNRTTGKQASGKFQMKLEMKQKAHDVSRITSNVTNV